VTLAILLASIAGSVNATGFLLLGFNTSHMSGNATVLGEALGGQQLELAWTSIKLILAFVLGAATTATLIELTRNHPRLRYVPTLLLEIALLGWLAVTLNVNPGARDPLLSQGLAFAMGLQNALVTRVSGAVVRTTHITGVLTDLGLEFVHWVRFWRIHITAKGVAGVLPALHGLFTAAEFGRFWLHVSIATSFIGGATAGAWLLLHVGARSLGLPCILLLGLLGHHARAVRHQGGPH
jgi:uncharacterized membrane protein YoaK (UPF0700 family)